MIKFYLRHYEKFASRIIVYDQQSTDGTREILEKHPLVEIREQTWLGHDDDAGIRLVNSAWIGEDCDWVMWPDIDEILYHPNVFWMLATAREDVIMTKGYALLSKTGFDPDFQGHIYEQITTGHPQDNYDKSICWRQGITMVHAVGRHPYSDFPKTNGIIGNEVKLKLLHCHYVGGAESTRKKNERMYDRYTNKKYGWVHDPKMQSNSKQKGTSAWVDDLLRSDKLIKVL